MTPDETIAPRSSQDTGDPAPRTIPTLYAVIFVLVVELILGGVRLGAPSWMGDEAIYASAARKAAVSGLWYPPRLRAGIYTFKPPLMIWLPAVSFRLLGVDELADRLPSALAGVAVGVLVTLFASWLVGPWSGAVAGVLLVSTTSWLFAHGVREGVGDSALTLVTMTGLLGMFRYRQDGRWPWVVGAAASLAAGTLLKGLVAPLVFLVTMLPWETMVHWRAHREDAPAGPVGRRLRSRWLISFAIVTPGLGLYTLWVADTLRRVPDFRTTMFDETFVRVITGIDDSHLHGPLFYVGVLWHAFTGWWLLLPCAVLAVWRMRRGRTAREQAVLLMAVWAVAPVVLFSLAASKLPWYVDPMLPAWAILLALGGAEVVRWLGARRWPVAAWMALVLIALSTRAVAAWREIPMPKPSAMARLALLSGQRPVRVWFDGKKIVDFRIREWDYVYLEEVRGGVQPLPQPYVPGRCDVVLSFRKARLEQEAAFAGATWYPSARRGSGAPLLMIADLCEGALSPNAPGITAAVPR